MVLGRQLGEAAEGAGPEKKARKDGGAQFQSPSALPFANKLRAAKASQSDSDKQRSKHPRKQIIKL
jgi:hypothetical protein